MLGAKMGPPLEHISSGGLALALLHVCSIDGTRLRAPLHAACLQVGTAFHCRVAKALFSAMRE